MKIGIIGAGFVGRAVAKLAINAGHQVMLSNSRGPQTLFSLKAMFGCETGTATEAATFGDVVLIAVPLNCIGQLPVAELAGKPVLDAVNYYPDRDGQIPELDEQATTTSEYLAGFLPESKVTKAFNAIRMNDLENAGLPAGNPQRRALPLSGDDEETKKFVAGLYDAFGFDTVDAGALSEGWRFERGMPSYCALQTQSELKAALEGAQRQVSGQ